jgi:hypothetical protein
VLSVVVIEIYAIVIVVEVMVLKGFKVLQEQVFKEQQEFKALQVSKAQ